MCCFHPRVQSVRHTRILARSAEKGRQYLVYSMTKTSTEDVAMILPLPVPAGTADDALRFIDLKGYPEFFDALDAGFPKTPAVRAEAAPTPGATPVPLAVVEVGDFEASFVPSVGDFGRLDERFRLPVATWELLPAVKGFGFAVFKLKKGAKTVQPMAFEFPRANPAKLFFPTIHIHDGKVHATADFDHELYAQSREGERLDLHDWEESPQPAGQFVLVTKTQGIVDGERHLYLRSLNGRRKNEDVLV
jgi:hypothetical protein